MWEWLHGYADRWAEAWGIVGAVATAATVVVTLLFAVAETRQRKRAEAERDAALERERSERRRQQRRARRAQAERVIAWHESREVVQSTWLRPKSGRGDPKLSPAPHAVVLNNSDLPVFDVEVIVHSEGRPSGERIKRLPVLAPGREVAEQFSAEDFPSYNEEPVVSLRFRDAAEVAWVRGEDGRLWEADDDEPYLPDGR